MSTFSDWIIGSELSKRSDGDNCDGSVKVCCLSLYKRLSTSHLAQTTQLTRSVVKGLDLFPQVQLLGHQLLVLSSCMLATACVGTVLRSRIRLKHPSTCTMYLLAKQHTSSSELQLL